jgi:Dolichyl-phosphate-mannose-protein mannosyltransferase
VALGTALLLGCTLRSVQYLARTSFWFDELALVLNVEQASLADLVSRPLARFQVAPAAFMAALRTASLLGGVNEPSLRLLPWACAVAAVIFFWRVAARVLGGWPLMGALLLFAASPALTWYGGNVKPYAGDVAFTLLLVLVVLRFDEHPDDRGRAAMGGVAGAVAALFSFPAVLTAAVAGLVLLGRWQGRRPRPPVAPLLALGGPWLAGIVAAGVLAMRQLDPETKAYMNRFWVDGFAPAPWTSIDALLWVPGRLFNAFGQLLLFIVADSPPGKAFVALCALLAVVGLAALFATWPWRAALVLAPTVAAVLGASARLLPFDGRVGIYAGWPLLVATMAGVQAMHSRLTAKARAAVAAIGILIVGLPVLFILAAGRPPYHHEEARPVLEAVARRWRLGDALYVYYGARYAMQFYGRRAGFTEWTTGECHREDPRAYFREADAFRGRPRVWFFYTHSGLGYREPAVIRSYLAAIGTERERIPDPFGGKDQSEAAAYLYDLSDPVRLAAGTAADHRFPEPRTGRPRVLCDGTRLSGGP